MQGGEGRVLGRTSYWGQGKGRKRGGESAREASSRSISRVELAMHAQFGDACARAKDVRWLGDQDEHGVRFYPVRHESIDFSALVHIAESPRLFSNVRQWFYMHDTCDVGRGFWPNATR
eukprot:6172787-Pleurochrysis_carterae.AAC.1